MLGGDHVDRVEGGEGVVDEHDAAAGGERRRDLGLAGGVGEQVVDGGVGGVGDLGIPRDEHRRTTGTVLRLGEQVGGGERSRHAAVGDDHDLGRSRERIDADRARDLALGQGDVPVAGADDHVDRADGLGAVRERGDGLGAADAVHLGDTDERRRRERGCGHRAVGRGRDAQHQLAHTRELRGDGGHQHRRRVRGATAGNVQAGPPDRHRQLTQGHAVALERRLRRGELRGVILTDPVGGDLECGAELGRGGVERGPRGRRQGHGARRADTRRSARSGRGRHRRHGRGRRRGWRAPTPGRRRRRLQTLRQGARARRRDRRSRGGRVGRARCGHRRLGSCPRRPTSPSCRA